MTLPHGTFSTAMFSGLSNLIFLRSWSLTNKHLFFIAKKELKEKLEHYEFNGPSEKVQQVEDELFEVNDTIKKLNA